MLHPAGRWGAFYLRNVKRLICMFFANMHVSVFCVIERGTGKGQLLKIAYQIAKTIAITPKTMNPIFISLSLPSSKSGSG